MYRPWGLEIGKILSWFHGCVCLSSWQLKCWKDCTFIGRWRWHLDHNVNILQIIFITAWSTNYLVDFLNSLHDRHWSKFYGGKSPTQSGKLYHLSAEASSTSWMPVSAHFIHTNLCIKYVKLGTNGSSAHKRSRCWTHHSSWFVGSVQKSVRYPQESHLFFQRLLNVLTPYYG